MISLVCSYNVHACIQMEDIDQVVAGHKRMEAKELPTRHVGHLQDRLHLHHSEVGQKMCLYTSVCMRVLSIHTWVFRSSSFSSPPTSPDFFHHTLLLFCVRKDVVRHLEFRPLLLILQMHAHPSHTQAQVYIHLDELRVHAKERVGVTSLHIRTSTPVCPSPLTPQHDQE